MQYCIWWIQDVNGDNYLMIFRPIQQYTVFTAELKSADCGKKILKHLVKKTRTNAGRKESPSYAIIDSQRVKTVAASEGRGIDGGKKQKAGNGTL